MPHPASPTALPAATLLAKRYRIDQVIGSGGYASVYRATDLTFGYERAIKEVVDPDPAVRAQFQLEADLLINTKHPNVPHGYNILEEKGRLYLVMEYIHGKDLEEILNDSLVQRHRPLDEAQVLRWAVDICDALQVMHTLNVPVIHRDIKPANIKITPEGRPVLIDFGLAKLQRSGRPTQTAAQGVSPGFAPPEQYMAKGRTDARTDIYGLGATLYAALTGKDPPDAPSRLVAHSGVRTEAEHILHPIRHFEPRVSEATDRAVLRALELAPAQRQQSAKQLRDELSAALQALTGAPAGAQAGARRAGVATPLPPDSSGKRASVQPGRGTLAAAFAGEPRTGKQVAVDGGDRATGKQTAFGQQRSGKQPVAPGGTRGGRRAADEAEPWTGRQVAYGAAGVAVATGAEVTPRAGQARAQRAAEAAPLTDAVLRLGTVKLSRLGKWVLALSAIELIWGLVVLALGVTTIATQGQPPLLQFGLIWLAIVAVLSLAGGQVISRDIYRRGRVQNRRRVMLGLLFLLLSLLVHGLAVWGASVFATVQANSPLAVVAYIAFGLNLVVLGALSVTNTLG